MPHPLQLRPADPRRVGRYRITGRVEGAAAPDESLPAATVFLAKRVDGAMVMITMLGRAWEGDPAAKDRFAAEAHAAGRVPPFCTARILDAGFEGATPYLVTEFVPGPSLAEVVEDEGRLEPQTLRALAIGCATGLAAIHQAGLVHGQLGPDTIVVGPEGPRVIHSSVTPPYGAATPAADMLAWAETILTAAMGRAPVGPQDLAALADDLREAVAACLTPDPAGRPTAREVLAELLGQHVNSAVLLAEGSRLAQFASRSPTAGPAPRASEPAPRGSGSRVIVWAAAFVTCVLAIVAAGAYITSQHSGSGAASATPAPGSSTHSLSPARSVFIPTQLAGAWSGQVHQDNPSLTVTVKLDFPAGGTAGTVTYPALNCSGTLPLTAASQGQVTVQQKITTGTKFCEGGVITLQPRPDGTLRFTFHNGPVGTLVRQH